MIRFLWFCLAAHYVFAIIPGSGLVIRSPGKGPAAEGIAAKRKQGSTKYGKDPGASGRRLSKSQQTKRTTYRQRKEDVPETHGLGYKEAQAEKKSPQRSGSQSIAGKAPVNPDRDAPKDVYAQFRAHGPATAHSDVTSEPVQVVAGTALSHRKFSPHKAVAGVSSTLQDASVAGKGPRVTLDATDFSGGGGVRVKASGPGYKDHISTVPPLGRISKQFRGSPSRPVTVNAEWGQGVSGTITSMNEKSADWDKVPHREVHQMEDV